MLLLLPLALGQTSHPTPSTVYVAHNTAAIKRYKTNPALVRTMVDRLVTSATNQSSVATAWSSLEGRGRMSSADPPQVRET